MIDLKLREEFTATASEDFKKNRMIGARYIDKTPLLATLLNVDHETTFFLRPRRFGKTLTLSMIRYFVEDTRVEAMFAASDIQPYTGADGEQEIDSAKLLLEHNDFASACNRAYYF